MQTAWRAGLMRSMRPSRRVLPCSPGPHLDVDHDVIVLPQLAHRLLAPLRACSGGPKKESGYAGSRLGPRGRAHQPSIPPVSMPAPCNTRVVCATRSQPSPPQPHTALATYRPARHPPTTHPPLGQSGSVITTSAPAWRHTSAIRSSSVATTTASSVLALQACAKPWLVGGAPGPAQ